MRAASAALERQRLITLLHVAKGDLRMSDEDYRAAIRGASGGAKESSKDLTVSELEAALAHFKRCGFKVRTKGPAKRRPKKPSRPLADDGMSKKIRALWLMLAELGAVKIPSEEALTSYVKRVTRVDALQWLTGDQAETVVETLKKWAQRFLPGAIEALIVEAKSLPLGYMKAMRLNEVLGEATRRCTFDPQARAWMALREAIAHPGDDLSHIPNWEHLRDDA